MNAYPMLEPRSLPQLDEPDARMQMHATMFTTRVPARTSHNWYSRVMMGCEASGISSRMEWKMRGKSEAYERDIR